MPQAIPLIVAYAAEAYVVAGLTVTLGVGAATIMGTAAFYATLIITSSALAKKESAPDVDVGAADTTERTQMVRQPITPWRTIYGQVRVSGPITFVQSDANNGYLNSILTLAEHEVEEIGDVFFNDERVPLDGFGNATGKYASHATIVKSLGAGATETAFHTAVSGYCSDWASTSKQSGMAKLFFRIKWNNDLYGGGIPQVTAIVKGKKIYDPRDAGTRYSPNVALCIWDYLRNTDTGVGATAAELSSSSFVAAANTCDELVAVASQSGTFTADATTDEVTFAGASVQLLPSDVVRLTTTGTLPAGLALATDYYVIFLSAGRCKLATSLANAIAGTAINITSAGAGTHTIQRTKEVRYAAHGTVNSDSTPRAVLPSLLGAMWGKLINAGGLWTLHAGAYRTPGLALDEDDLDGSIKLTTRITRRELFNRVKGEFTNAYGGWQPTDYPPVVNATYLSEDDNEQNWKDYDLSGFIISGSAAQRIAKIELEAVRQQITVILPCKLVALQAQAGDLVTVTNTRFGWSSKVFEVVEWKFVVRGTTDAPHLGIDLVLRETASAVYDWNSGMETIVDPAPNTNLPSWSTVTALSGLALASGTAYLDTRLDGTVFSRIYVSWTVAADAFVSSGGSIEVQYKKSSDSPWISLAPLPGSVTSTYLLDVKDGVAYDVRARAVNFLSVPSAWATVSSHTVVGKTAVPANVASLSAQQNGVVVTFKWPQVADIDLAGYELRYMAAPFVWDNATVLTAVTRGTLVTNTGLPPGAWVVGIKARDTSENYSAVATTTAITVTNSNDIVYQSEQYPNWRGTLSNMIMHPTRVLVPDSQTLASNMTDAQLWNQMVYNPYASPYYEAPVVDLGFDADSVRVYSESVAVVGPGESGVADPLLRIDYKIAAGAYDGFEDWTVGFIQARYVKSRVQLDTASGVAYVSRFKPIVDVQERTLTGVNVAIAVSGTTIAFSPQFHGIPSFVPAAQSAAGAARFAVWESLTATSVVVKVFDAAGVDVGGTINWEATGA